MSFKRGLHEHDFSGCDFEKCFRVSIIPKPWVSGGVSFEIHVSQSGRVTESLYTLIVTYDELPLALENVGEFLALKFKGDKNFRL